MLDERSVLQRDEINRLSLQLRTAYYDTHTEDLQSYSKPYGGAMTESIGAWPEFILKGTFCKRSSKGLCSPCFYSRFPLSKSSRSDYLEMVKEQVYYVTNNFEALVSNYQYGQAFTDSSSISLVLTPTGSFFDGFEFPIDIRLEMEQALVEIAESQKIDIQLHIESHCEDFIAYDVSNENSKKEINLLKKLNTRVVFGFESVDEYTRNVLYNKSLALSDFELAINKINSVDLSPGAFVFAGLFAHNDRQAHDDVISTVDYLLRQSVFPVIMFQNDQPYTITDVLLKNGKISLLEPLTVAWIISDIIGLLKKHPSYWLIADPIGGPPEPDCHIFKEAKITDQSCSASIYKALVDLRKNRILSKFSSVYEHIKNFECYERHKKYISSLPIDFKSAQTNTDMLLQECCQNISPYLKEIGGVQ